MKRREFVKLSGAAAASIAIIPPVLQSCADNMNMNMNMGSNAVPVKEGAFTTPLTFPSVMTSNFSMQAKGNTVSLLNAQSTSVLGYTDGILGPTIKVDNGSDVSIAFQNQLSEETNVHWHGLLVPANMDGHPKDVINSGSSFNFNLPLSQRAGTYWYHPHPHGKTARQVFMGLAGFFIVNDSEEQSLNLPSGDQELLLVIQDKRIKNGQLNYSPSMDEVMTGYTGEYVLVNGRNAPFHNVSTRYYRLRILNGSTARVYNIAFSDNQSFEVIGTDGGLLAQPVTVNSLLIGPGERADILVSFKSFSVGKEVYLISRTFNGGAQGRQEFKIMKFVVNQQASDSFTVPNQLSSIQPIAPASASKTRIMKIKGMMEGMNMGSMGSGMHTINDKVYDLDRIDETVQAGATEIWEFDNSDGDEIHPMHIHGVQFQVLQRTGGRGSLIATEQGWKDTVLVMPREKVTVIMTFPQEKGVFVFHCHNLEHEDDGMMLNYEVV
ncbi:MAG TPA: multicopper oxidase domain-containing protein [Cyclobacteriaceae bacterium]|nr:multicopper oxidase domain-containing protein [Cyclobacteriaceae bacterium]HRJ80933.1 multicopper oxidase domain-containing protein [Cyclobacteriaceae bacterium]